MAEEREISTTWGNVFVLGFVLVCRGMSVGDGLPEIADPLIAQLVADRYRIIRKLGEGGMGAVYLAEHVVIEKKFALKVLAPELTCRPDLVARFLQEARSASRIGHENVIDIMDFGQSPDGLVYIAMEFLDGKDLGDIIRTDGALAWPQARDLALQICRALRAAHDKGIVHRDMKPENIFLIQRVGQPRFVKILDFGIAKVMGLDPSGPRLTKTGMIFGTPEYMAPEQAEGKDTDHRADIYAVGCILYHLLTGQTPFVAESFMTMLTKHLMEEPVPPSARRPDLAITKEMDGIVLRALEKDRDKRWQSMAELHDAVERCLGPHGTAVTQAQPEPPRQPHRALEIGDVIADRYRILRKLGEGGMGAVYLTQHVAIEKRFALKVLAPKLAQQSDFVARFLREARSASQIQHENVIDILDFAQSPDGLVYIAMEFLDGEDLGVRLRDQGAMAWGQAREIVRQICLALQVAHANGIVHRDMKPENIVLIRRQGKPELVKILDFGIAKVVGQDVPHLTRAGAIFGTPEYMAPEQAEAKDIDHRTDIYAVGCILYHLITGETPFVAPSSVAMLAKHINEDPVPPSKRGPDLALTPGMDAVILKALAKDPEHRWQSMTELYEAVEACDRAWWKGRRFTRVALVCLAISAALGVTVAVKATARKSVRSEAQGKPSIETTASKGPTVAPTTSSPALSPVVSPADGSAPSLAEPVQHERPATAGADLPSKPSVAATEAAVARKPTNPKRERAGTSGTSSRAGGTNKTDENEGLNWKGQ